MFRLTREVRFAVNLLADDQLANPPSNSYGGFPSLTGFGQYFRMQVTLQGELGPHSGYLVNIKEIDQVVRERIIGGIAGSVALIQRGHADLADASLAAEAFVLLHDAWPNHKLHSIHVWLTPFFCLTQLASEFPMQTRLSQKFEFCASHRLFNPALSDEENRRVYGKCSHPSGHGHNYELQVTLRGAPKHNGLLVDVPLFEKVVNEHVIERFDHKNLNIDVPEFKEVVPSVENIAKVIYRLLKNRITGVGAELASVTVWETAKTSCEYFE